MKTILCIVSMMGFACASRDPNKKNASPQELESKQLVSYKEKYGLVDYLKEEPFPANSLPTDLLERDRDLYLKSETLPKITPTKIYKNTQYGIRLFEHEKRLFRALKPGDIQVNFNPLNSISNPLQIIVEGMRHASIVVKNEGGSVFSKKVQKNKEFCHIDSPPESSDCDFSYPSHYFRVISFTEKQAEEVAHEASSLFTQEAYEYSSRLRLNIASLGCPLMDEKIFEAKAKVSKLQVYCSELPYMLYSTLNKQEIFPAIMPSEVLRTFSENVKNGHFVFAKSPEKTVSYFTEMDQTDNGKGSLKNTMTSSLLTILSQVFYDGYTSSAVKAGLDYHTGGTVMPSIFMKQAKMDVSKKIIVYLGTFLDESKFDEKLFSVSPGTNFELRDKSGFLLAFNSKEIFYKSPSDFPVVSYRPREDLSARIEGVRHISPIEAIVVESQFSKRDLSPKIVIKRLMFNPYSKVPSYDEKIIREYKSEEYLKHTSNAKLIAHMVDLGSRENEFACVGISIKHHAGAAEHYSTVETFCITESGATKVLKGLGISEISYDAKKGINIHDGKYNEEKSRFEILDFRITDLKSRNDLFTLHDNGGQKYQLLGFKGTNDRIYFVDKSDNSIKRVLLDEANPKAEKYVEFAAGIDLNKDGPYYIFNDMHVFAHLVDSSNGCKQCTIEIKAIESGEVLEKIIHDSQVLNLKASVGEDTLYFLDISGDVHKHQIFYKI